MAYQFHRKIWVKRDAKARKIYLLSEINKLILKSLISEHLNKDGNIVKKYYFSKAFHKFGRNSCISYYRRGCHSTGSGRSIFKFFKYSRHDCKKLSSNGLILGMRKSSF